MLLSNEEEEDGRAVSKNYYYEGSDKHLGYCHVIRGGRSSCEVVARSLPPFSSLLLIISNYYLSCCDDAAE